MCDTLNAVNTVVGSHATYAVEINNYNDNPLIRQLSVSTKVLFVFQLCKLQVLDQNIRCCMAEWLMMPRVHSMQRLE